MKKALVAALAGLLTVGMAQKFSVEAGAGLYGNLGGQLAVVAEDLAPGLPLGVRLGVGFATSDALDDGVEYPLPGQKWGDYKKNNELSEWGQNITLSLDVLYKVNGLGLPVEVAPYVGLRYNFFSGGYTDPKNNLPIKSQTSSSNQFGFGAGIRVAYPLMPNLSVVGDLGVDYYLKACFNVATEDDSGNVSRATICPSDSGYDSKDKLTTQPEWVFKARVGVAYRF